MYPFFQFLNCFRRFLAASDQSFFDWNGECGCSPVNCMLQHSELLEQYQVRVGYMAISDAASSLKCATAKKVANSTTGKPECVSFVARCQMRALRASFLLRIYVNIF